MKISSELERMGDLADNIAQRALELNGEPQLKPYIDIPVSYTHLRAHETVLDLVCRLLLEKKNINHS